MAGCNDVDSLSQSQNRPYIVSRSLPCGRQRQVLLVKCESDSWVFIGGFGVFTPHNALKVSELKDH